MHSAKKPQNPQSSSTSISGKAQTKSIVHDITRQLTTEPFEIGKNVTEQLIGNYPKAKKDDQTPLDSLSNVDLQAKKRKEARHLQAFREELEEIKQLQQKRSEGARQEKAKLGQQQIDDEQQKRQEESAPVEVMSKQKRGLMQGVKKKVTNMLDSFRFKKSRERESQKTFSN